MFFKHTNPVGKQLLNLRNVSVLYCFRNSSVAAIWNNLGLSNYKCMKGILNLGKNTWYNSKRNYLVPYSKESALALMHLWQLSTIPSFWEEYFAERLRKDVS